MLINYAAWIPSSRAQFTVKEAPYTSPGPGHITIRNSAVAINPLDYKIQDLDPLPRFPIAYPTILGSDVAGTIVEIGDDVTTLQVGQHVVAHSTGFATNTPEGSAFQHYTTVHHVFVTKLPTSVPFSTGVVLPLSVDSAAAGLFQPDHLALSLPSSHPNPSDNSTSNPGTILVWGGASSVGCSVIQIAAHALNLSVITTASTKNFDLCRSLGAEKVLDYRDADVVDKIASSLQGRDCVGAFNCVGDADTIRLCAEALEKISTTSAGSDEQGRKKRIIVSVLEASKDLALPASIEVRRCDIRTMFATEIPSKIHAWVGKAFEEGRMVPKLDATVVGHGLEQVQEGLNRLRNGVSATKLVVTL